MEKLPNYLLHGKKTPQNHAIKSLKVEEKNNLDFKFEVDGKEKQSDVATSTGKIETVTDVCLPGKVETDTDVHLPGKITVETSTQQKRDSKESPSVVNDPRTINTGSSQANTNVDVPNETNDIQIIRPISIVAQNPAPRSSINSQTRADPFNDDNLFNVTNRLPINPSGNSLSETKNHPIYSSNINNKRTENRYSGINEIEDFSEESKNHPQPKIIPNKIIQFKKIKQINTLNTGLPHDETQPLARNDVLPPLGRRLPNILPPLSKIEKPDETKID